MAICRKDSAGMATAEKAGVSDQIRFMLCDGLADCPPDEIDSIVIAGMGGDTICGILDRAEWCMSPDYLLILQPMTKAEVLRFWLVNNGFLIEREELVADGGSIYQILTARFCDQNTRLSDAELYLGEFSKIKDHPLFPDYLRQQRSRFQTRIHGLLSGERKETGQLQLLQQILSEMDAMEEKTHDKSL